MPTISIGFEWPRGRGYAVVEPALRRSKGDPFAAKFDEPHIRQTGRTEKENPARRPLEIHPSLYLEFAKLKSSDDYITFARNWGLLKNYAELGAQEALSLWKREIETMKETVESLRRAIDEKVIRPRGFLITTIDVFLVSGLPDGGPALSLQPQNLRDAMRIQLAQSIASGNLINVCPVCGQWFEKGGRGGGAKRSIARFCSDKCRNQFHNERRASK
jgi:hypothetical protein